MGAPASDPWLSAGQKMAMIGGTNGIGRALTRLFAANGAKAVVVGRTFRDQGLERLRFIHADLSEMKQAQRVVQELSAESWDMLLFTSGERTRQGGTCGKLRRHRNRRRH